MCYNKGKIFRILRNEILDIEIKEFKNNVVVDRIAELAERLYEQLEQENTVKHKPEQYNICAECRQPIGNEEYIYTKTRGYPPTFIHKWCYEKLLPKNKSSK